MVPMLRRRTGASLLPRARRKLHPQMAGTDIEISVVVPSHERPLRLRWLLNALEEQTLDRARWELVVVHDCRGEATAELLRTHPLAAAGVLRTRRLPEGTGTPARQRNVGWRMARAP